MSHLIHLQNKLINKSEILLAVYDSDNKEYDLQIVTKQGDIFTILASNEQERQNIIFTLESQATHTDSCDLFLINPGDYINLKQITAFSVIKDKNQYIGQVDWKDIRTLPKTFILENIHSDEDVQALLNTIRSRN